MYRQRAGIYDLELALFEPLRLQAVALLALRAGDTVLDLGCGTGLSLPLLAPAVGPRGHVIGIEQSPEMLGRARERVAQAGWRQVRLVEAPVETAPVHVKADAALFHFTHDILQQPCALDKVLRLLKPGARVAAVGLQWAPPWAALVNLFVLPAALHSVSSLAGMDAPWRGLQARLGKLQVESLLGGGVYIAHGTVPQSLPQ